MIRRATAVLLLLALLLAPAALASQALGWELYQTDTVLGPGLSVSSQILWGDSRQDYRREQYAVYTPGKGTSPLVCYGASVPATATLTSMAKGLEEYGYRVLAGANGDYFVMASGVPLGLVVSYGALRSSSSYHYAVGFDAEGNCFVGKPDLSVTAAFHGYALSVSGGYNKSRDAKGGYYLYSEDFGATTKASGGGVNVVLRPVVIPEGSAQPEKPGPAPAEPTPPEGLDVDAIWAALEGQSGEDGTVPEVDEAQLAALNQWEETRAQWAADMAAWEESMERWKQALGQWAAGLETAKAALSIGGGLSCVVESVTEGSGASDIPKGRLVLSIAKSGDSFLVDEARALVPGEKLELSVTSPDPRWERAYTAIGAYHYILQGGEVPSGLEQNADPRTALGVRADGTVLLYTIDGRRSGHSVGASVQQVARRLQELGCVDAVLFDGGGSTSFGTTGALDRTFALTNKPSEGSQRAVSDALFFVSQQTPTGVLGSVHLRPQSALMLSGASQSLEGLGMDTGYYPLGEEPLGGLRYTVDGPGRMEGDVFIAGSEKGVATVTATASGGATGTARMTVVDTPDAIDITDATGAKVTSLNLDPGQGAALNAAASWYKLPLVADDGCFTWSLSAQLGSVDDYGNVTAGSKAGSGALTVSAGEKSVSIPITVGGHITPMEDFEGDECQFRVLEEAEVSLSTQRVKYGHQAMEVRPQAPMSMVETYMGLNDGETDISFWVYAQDALSIDAHYLLADGSTVTDLVTPVVMIPGEWNFAQAVLPEGAEALIGLTFKTWEQKALYLDQFSSTNGGLQDETPPTAKLTAKNGQLTATLWDNVDKTFDAARLELTLDGWSVDFALAGNTLTAAVPTDGLLHRVSLTVRDASGNLARASVELPPAAGREPHFLDVEGHWARDHITYLYDQGVTNGRAVEGGFAFDPQTNITRGEFATMLARWLRADLSGAGEGPLPFADADQIPAWAFEAVGYLYQTGVMAGSLEGDGLYARANDPITRAQAMTMLGRIQARGYAAQAEVFADDDQIPAWAREYVYTLAGQGVVSGYEGLVRPLDPITRGEVAKLLTTLW